MRKSTRNLLVAQGYDEQVVDNNIKIIYLAKWTPFACAIFASIGLVFQSGIYLVILGSLTFVGAFTTRSLYDYLYRYIFSDIINLGDMPKHGTPRRIGCGMGACMFVISGIGFLENLPLLAYIPSLFMITFSLIAGFSNWCFVSTFYGLIVGKKQRLKSCLSN
jgi:hypothetical protein